MIPYLGADIGSDYTLKGTFRSKGKRDKRSLKNKIYDIPSFNDIKIRKKLKIEFTCALHSTVEENIKN